ncbi:MAG: SseB family protein [Clostridia bacterium]|nr:SseB family protein [Clostridia bacterium]
MFFKKDKDLIEKPENINETPAQEIVEEETGNTIENFLSKNPEETEFPYSFHKVEPYPMDLVSVITKMLQKLFPDTRKAYLLEARQNKKRGYLLIVDIEPKFLKIINIYADGETKKVRGDVPIECILYSKSGTITEGIDPFFVKETAESKANNLASKEFSGEIVFSEMPEFELWKNTDKKDVHTDGEDAQDVLSPLDEENEETVNKEIAREEAVEGIAQEPEKAPEDKTDEKLVPSDKKELFAILKEYAEKTSESAKTLASAAIKEFVFCIPYSCKDLGFTNETDSVLPIDESLKFEVLVNPEDEKKAVPLYTDKDEALEFAQNNNCRVAVIKYKDFASSLAAEQAEYDGVVINPNSECIIFPVGHSLLAE